MERLTKRINDVVTYIGTENEYDTGMIAAETASSVAAVREILLRLAAYEDSGLSPQACAQAAEIEKQLASYDFSAKKMLEFIRADKDGRVIVLPAKKGDTWKKAMSILDKKYAEAKKLPFVRDPLAWALYHTWKEFDDEKRCD